MKIAISLPDEEFREAERLAERLSVSRSELYRRALREFLARHAPDPVTQALDEVCGTLEDAADPFVTEAGRRALRREEW